MWLEVLCWIYHVWSSKYCVSCACNPSVCLDAPTIYYISSFKSFRPGSQVFSVVMLFICVILHTVWSGRSLHFLGILPFGMLCLYAISMICL